jgi:hypothetical protein
MSRSILVVALSLSSLCACSSTVDGSGAGGGGEGGAGGGGGGETPDCEAPSAPEPFELGTGETCFARVAAGETLPLVQGPQGGYHLWVAVSCTGCAEQLYLRYGALDPVTGEAFPNTYATEGMVDLVGDASYRQRAQLTAVMPGVPWDPETYPPLEKGARVLLYVELLEGSEVVERRELEVRVGDTVSWDPCAEDPESPYCGFG